MNPSSILSKVSITDNSVEIFDEGLDGLHTEMQSQSWENNPDLSLLPHEGQSKQIKIG